MKTPPIVRRNDSCYHFLLLFYLKVTQFQIVPCAVTLPLYSWSRRDDAKSSFPVAWVDSFLHSNQFDGSQRGILNYFTKCHKIWCKPMHPNTVPVIIVNFLLSALFSLFVAQTKAPIVSLNDEVFCFFELHHGYWHPGLCSSKTNVKGWQFHYQDAQQITTTFTL